MMSNQVGATTELSDQRSFVDYDKYDSEDDTNFGVTLGFSVIVW